MFKQPTPNLQYYVCGGRGSTLSASLWNQNTYIKRRNQSWLHVHIACIKACVVKCKRNTHPCHALGPVSNKHLLPWGGECPKICIVFPGFERTDACSWHLWTHAISRPWKMWALCRPQWIPDSFQELRKSLQSYHYTEEQETCGSVDKSWSQPGCL